jgi:hypothetical protein
MWNLYLTGVGSKSISESVKASFAFRAEGRVVIEGGAEYQQQESLTPYKAFFKAENEYISPESVLGH